MNLATSKLPFLALNKLLLLIRHHFQVVGYLHIPYKIYCAFSLSECQTCLVRIQCLSCEISSV